MFSHYHVAYRGPAQDVERVVHAAGGLELQVIDSNDQALEDNSAHWDMYNPHPYAPQPFLGHYLEQCRLWGKSPIDPYRTSFLTMYVNPSDPRLGDSNYLDQARHLAAPYDLVLRPIPPLPPLTAPGP